MLNSHIHRRNIALRWSADRTVNIGAINIWLPWSKNEGQMTGFRFLLIMVLSPNITGRCPCVLTGISLTGWATAQETAPLEQMMELNRSGKWEQAAQLTQRFIYAKPEKSKDEFCQAYYSLIYSQTRLGQTEQAKSHLIAFDQKCADVATSNWVLAALLWPTEHGFGAASVGAVARLSRRAWRSSRMSAALSCEALLDSRATAPGRAATAF